ncbi:thimet oligopeptidase-like [Eschrichtius robustus]|uniref:thimet oligopeptidase-like n=1 Tax=Eschrichtius robustus TaxID=9764 RepID=UPI0035BF0564
MLWGRERCTLRGPGAAASLSGGSASPSDLPTEGSPAERLDPLRSARSVFLLSALRPEGDALTGCTAGDENLREGSGAGSVAPCEALALLPVSVGHRQRHPPGHAGSSPPSPSSHPPCLFNLCPIILAKLDQPLHMQTPSYPAQENARLCEEMLGVPATPGTHLPATFGHLAGSYDAHSYVYLCSEVYSADTFHTLFKQDGVLSGKVAMDYRSCILRPGGSEDAKGMVKPFLGCNPTQDAFLLSKGLQVEGCRPPAC